MSVNSPNSTLTSLTLQSHQGLVEVAFYLPHSPVLPANWQAQQSDAIGELIALNGNHWRKIFTIMAKLCSRQPPSSKAWQTLREQLFVPSSPEALSRRLHLGANTLDPEARWHIICGQQAQQQLGIIDTENSKALDEQGKLRTQLNLTGLTDTLALEHEQDPLGHEQHLLFTPYLDYRQFPNRLIERAHALVHG